MCISQFKNEKIAISRSMFPPVSKDEIHTNYGVVRSKANKNLKNQ